MGSSVKLNDLKCSQCLLRIVPPFKICIKDHFVCTRCNRHQKPSAGGGSCQNVEERACLNTEKPSEEIDKKFNNLKKYCQFGCGLRQSLSDLYWHEDYCSRRNYAAKCIIGDCSWQGLTSTLIDHVEETHPDNLIVNCQQPNRVLNLSFSKSEYLVILYDKSYYCNDLYWVLFSSDANNRFIVIYRQGSVGQTVRSMDNYMLLNPIDGRNVEAGLCHIQYMCDDSNINITKIEGDIIKVFLKTYGIEYLPSHIAQKLQCGFCKGLLCAPINLCMCGHSVCGPCKNKNRGECPECSGDVMEVRNYAIEKLTETFPKNCTNPGCLESVQASIFKEHLQECHFRNINCVRGCDWKGPFCKFYDHYSVDHSWFKGNGIPCSIREQPSVLDTSEKILIEFGKMFVMQYIFNTSFDFRVMEVTNDSCSNFDYEIRFRNKDTGYTVGFSSKCLVTKTIKDMEDFYNDYKNIDTETLLKNVCDEKGELECVLHVFTG